MSDLGTPTKFGSVWAILAAAAALIGWDVYAALSPNQPTISAFMLHYARLHSVLPFSFGVLMGHLFWPQTVAPQTPTEAKQ